LSPNNTGAIRLFHRHSQEKFLLSKSVTARSAKSPGT